MLSKCCCKNTKDMNQKVKLNQFLQACFQGDLKAVKSGVKGSQAFVNMSDERGISSLHAA